MNFENVENQIALRSMRFPIELRALYRGGRHHLAILRMLRECRSNSYNFNGKNEWLVPVYLDFLPPEHRNWFLFADDATPFDNLKEIVEKGVSPNSSKGNRQALQGMGLWSAAAVLMSEPRVIIGSNTVEEGWKWAMGICKSAENELAIYDVSESWGRGIEKFLNFKGNKHLEKMKVVYVFEVGNILDYVGKSAVADNGARGKYAGNISSAALMGSFGRDEEQASLRFSEVVAGKHPMTKAASQLKRRTLKECWMSADDSLKRYFRNEKDWLDRLCAFEESQVVSLKDYPIEDAVVADIDVKCTVRLCPGFYRYSKTAGGKKSKNLTRWLVQLRHPDLSVDNHVPPTVRTGLTCSWVHTYWQEKKPKLAARYERFRTNVMATHQQIDTLMGDIGLQYVVDASIDCFDLSSFDSTLTHIPDGIGKFEPFPLIHFDIVDIKNARDKETLTSKGEYDPWKFLSWMRRTPDFFFEESAAAKAIMRMAAQAMDPSSKLKSLCKQFFPLTKNQGTKIPIAKILGETTNEAKPCSKHVEVYVLSEDEQLADSKIRMGVNESVQCCVLHLNEDRSVPGNEIEPAQSCRGIEFSDVTQIASNFPNVKAQLKELRNYLRGRDDINLQGPLYVINVVVSPCKDAEGHPIDIQDWEPRTCFPSRAIRGSWNDRPINLGVVDLPVEDRDQDTPVPPGKTPDPDGTLQGDIPIVGNTPTRGIKEVDPFTTRKNTKIPFRWKSEYGGMLGITKGGKYGPVFSASVGGKLEQQIINFYDELNSLATPMHNWCDKLQTGSVRAVDKIPQVYQDEKKAEGLGWGEIEVEDVLINQVLEATIADPKSAAHQLLLDIEQGLAQHAAQEAEKLED